MVDYYPRHPSSSEIDMRDELRRFLVGDDLEIPKEKKFILRRMRRNSLDQLVPCACLNSLTKEGDRDRFCPYCFGEGFLWDEEFISGVHVEARRGNRRKIQEPLLLEPVILDPMLSYLYLFYYVNPTIQDRIIAPQVDDAGRLVWPIKISQYWHIEAANPMWGENGRIDYWVLTIRENLVGGLNG